MIHSIFIGSDAELVERILRLHRCGRRVLDVTFGNGRFWGDEGMTGIGHEGRTVVGLDRRMATELAGVDIARTPQVTGRVAGNFEQLPFKADSFDVVICDPPFMSRGEGTRMNQRYSSNESYEQLLISLQTALPEFTRVLSKDGVVLFKIMDLTEGRRRRWTHIDVANLWARALRLDDVFIKVAPQSMESSSWKNQVRSRVAHSYFMVFKMRRQTRNNGSSGDVTDPTAEMNILHRSGRQIGNRETPLALAAGVENLESREILPK